MNLPQLVDFVNVNAGVIRELIAEEINLVDTEHRMSVDDRLYALAMFCRAPILDLEAKAAKGPVH